LDRVHDVQVLHDWHIPGDFDEQLKEIQQKLDYQVHRKRSGFPTHTVRDLRMALLRYERILPPGRKVKWAEAMAMGLIFVCKFWARDAAKQVHLSEVAVKALRRKLQPFIDDPSYLGKSLFLGDGAYGTGFKITRAEFARCLGTTKPTIEKWMRGEKVLHPERFESFFYDGVIPLRLQRFMAQKAFMRAMRLLEIDRKYLLTDERKP